MQNCPCLENVHKLFQDFEDTHAQDEPIILVVAKESRIPGIVGSAGVLTADVGHKLNSHFLLHSVGAVAGSLFFKLASQGDLSLEDKQALCDSALDVVSQAFDYVIKEYCDK